MDSRPYKKIRTKNIFLSCQKMILKIFIFWKFENFRKIQWKSALNFIRNFIGCFQKKWFFKKIEKWKFSKSFFDTIKIYFSSRFFCKIWNSSLDSISSKIEHLPRISIIGYGKFRNLQATYLHFGGFGTFRQFRSVGLVFWTFLVSELG